jgi:hypothetical protein
VRPVHLLLLLPLLRMSFFVFSSSNYGMRVQQQANKVQQQKSHPL